MERQHFNIAEYGKACALNGDHVEALIHYREAMAIAVDEKAPLIILRHYMECSLESLEHLSAWDELLRYCAEALQHYCDHPPKDNVTKKDLATVYQRQGIVYLKAGDEASAKEAFSNAIKTAKQANISMPLAEKLFQWLQSRIHVPLDRIASEQQRYHYFSVRNDVNSSKYSKPAEQTHSGSVQKEGLNSMLVLTG